MVFESMNWISNSFKSKIVNFSFKSENSLIKSVNYILKLWIWIPNVSILNHYNVYLDFNILNLLLKLYIISKFKTLSYLTFIGKLHQSSPKSPPSNILALLRVSAFWLLLVSKKFYMQILFGGWHIWKKCPFLEKS